MDINGCESALAIRLDRLSEVGGGVQLRSFAIWCAMQCQLSRLQARFVSDCVRALRERRSRIRIRWRPRPWPRDMRAGMPPSAQT